MCLIVFSYHNHQKYPLILAGNRDEFYSRPTKEAHFWNSEPRILAGRDLKAGGTWLGVSENGSLGAVTNYRDLYNARTGERSRGELIPRLLNHSENLNSALQEIIEEAEKYDGFNLIAGSANDLYYISNITKRVDKISPGLHGISNAFLDTSWPKVDVAKSEFEKSISGRKIDEESIFTLLKNSEIYPDEDLPDTGLTQDMEKAVSPIFIKTDDYGTRCSSLLMVDKDNVVTFIERNHPAGDVNSQTEHRFQFKIGSQIV